MGQLKQFKKGQRIKFKHGALDSWQQGKVKSVDRDGNIATIITPDGKEKIINIIYWVVELLPIFRALVVEFRLLWREVFKKGALVLLFLIFAFYASAQEDCIKVIKVQGEAKGCMVVQDNCMGRLGQIVFPSDEAIHAFVDATKIITPDDFLKNGFLEVFGTDNRNVSLCDCEEERKAKIQKLTDIRKVAFGRKYNSRDYLANEVRKIKENDDLVDASYLLYLFDSYSTNSRNIEYLSYRISVILESKCLPINGVCKLDIKEGDDYIDAQIESTY